MSGIKGLQLKFQSSRSLPEGDEKAEPEDIEPGSSEMSQWTFGSRERDYRKEAEPDIADALPRLKPKKPEPETESKVQASHGVVGLSNQESNADRAGNTKSRKRCSMLTELVWN